MIIVISTGRCGTKRLTEILSQILSPLGYTVNHQQSISRLANVLGNLMYYFGSLESLKSFLFKKHSGHESNQLIITDPLISMCIPSEIKNSEDVFFLHIERKPEEFANSMFRLTRKRPFSWIAHNLIPLWQPDLWPLENTLSPWIKKKYVKICQRKNQWFEKEFESTAHYKKVEMNQLFSGDFLQNYINSSLGIDISFDEDLLRKKSNTSG